MGKDLADIRANVSTAVDMTNGIKVRGKIIGISEDPEDSARRMVEIRITTADKGKKDSGHDSGSSISYSIPTRLTEDLEIGREIVITLTPQ